ncbi:putative metalloprotease CJM1_0395 family protein [Ferrovibrio xuzhouensis]|uniref:Metalloprotease CJM1_0395 family protein n=1 Tax=Ferrovibrio xuzhouensis TaxID=1576914 RepID=A0ABV7VAP1_9PROT
MVDGTSSAQLSGTLSGSLLAPATGSQTRTAVLEAAFPGLKVLGGASDSAAQQKQDSGSTVGGGQKPALASGDTLLAAQQQDSDGAPKAPGELSEEEKQQVAKLKQVDAKVRAHERAHAAVGGQYAGAPSYGYTRGPDGQQYAVSGEVAIDIGAERDPEATLQKATQVQAAALAPADPSGQDRAVAAAAAQLRLQALSQIREEKRAETEQQEAGRAADRAAAAEREQVTQGSGEAGDAAPAVPGQPAAGNSTAAATPAAATTGSQTPAARASSAYANDNAGLNRLVGQVVGISA